MPKNRRHKPPQEKEEGDLKGRFRCRYPSWWDTTDKAELHKAHERGKQLIDGGYGAVDWEDLFGSK